MTEISVLPDASGLTPIVYHTFDNHWLVNGLLEAEILLRSSFGSSIVPVDSSCSRTSFFLAADMLDDARCKVVKAAFAHALRSSNVSKWSSQIFRPLAETLVLSRSEVGTKPSLAFQEIDRYMRESLFALIGIAPSLGEEMCATYAVALRFFRDDIVSEKGRAALYLSCKILRSAFHEPQAKHSFALISILKQLGVSDDRELTTIFLPIFEMIATARHLELPVISFELLCHESPKNRQRIIRDQGVTRRAILEAARFLNSFDLHRVMKCSIHLGNVHLLPGEKVLIRVREANMDPRVFDEPRVFNPWRRNLNRSLSFGTGAHSCIARELALELTSILLRHLITPSSRSLSLFAEAMKRSYLDQIESKA